MKFKKGKVVKVRVIKGPQYDPSFDPPIGYETTVYGDGSPSPYVDWEASTYTFKGKPGQFINENNLELIQDSVSITPSQASSLIGSPEYEGVRIFTPHPKKDVGLKFDQGKPPMSLLATGWLQGVANALGFGAKKYGPFNWRSGIEQSRLIDAAMRHITAYNDGQDLDPESGLSHLYHASANLMFASELLKSHPELDDRYKKESNEK